VSPRPICAFAATATATFVAVLVAVLGAGVLAAPGASADTASDAVAALQANPPIYVGDTGAVISNATVIAALPTFARIAIVAAGSASPERLAEQIGKGLDPSGSQRLVVAVVSGRSFGAVSSRYCGGYAEAKAEQAVNDHVDQLKAGGDHPDLTSLVNDFGNLMQSGPAANTSACGSASGSDISAKGDSGSSSGWAWLVGILVVIFGGLGALIFFSRRRARRQLGDARAQVEPYVDRLASEVTTIDPADNAVARQAMADASERLTSAGSQLQTASSIARLVTVRQTVLQGLYAARTARAALGLDLGPPLPSITNEADQLNEQRPVTVQGQTFQGYPNYAPNAPYYYGGGYGVPGGWYGTPFWQTLLLTSALSGGFGGWGFGGGYNNGYGSGYDSGYQAGQNAGDGNADSGGNWGGGDWGGGGGGGDWGGGGSDGGANW
jgi:hypothetical protein